jgi:cysteine synthase A
VALAPDFGERYLDTIYQTHWVRDLYGEDVLAEDALAEDALAEDELATAAPAA